MLTRIFHENALASASSSPPEADGVRERTTIKWSKYLTFRRFHAAFCRELQLLSRDHEDGCATWQPSRVPRDWFRAVPERYVAEADSRGRQEGWPYYARSLRSAQSRNRVPSFVVAASDSWNIRVKPQSADRVRIRPPKVLLKALNNHSVDKSYWHFGQISLKGCYLVIF